MIKSKVSTLNDLETEIGKVYEGHHARLSKMKFSETSKPGVYKAVYEESTEDRNLRYALMNKALEHKLGMDDFMRQGGTSNSMAKASLSVGSGLTWYDLREPSLHLVPWLSPIRNSLPRVQRADPSDAARWKTILATSLTSGGLLADPWINEGQRAPLFSFSAVTNTLPYISIGNDGSVTYEAQAAARGLEDAESTARFFCLEQLMVKEEDAILGGNKTLKLGQANTPTVTDGGASSASTITGATYSVIVVGLTYAGFRNNNGGTTTAATSLTQYKTITTPDTKVMTVNGGTGIKSSNGTAAITTGHLLNATVTPKNGELAWAWYVGTIGNEMLQTITTVPAISLSSLISTGNQLASTLVSTDFSVNDGVTGGQSNQVTAFDGLLVQTINNAALSPANAYYLNMANTTLTASGRGSITQIDTMLQTMWNNFRITPDVLYVNAQELTNITSKCLSNASGPLLRYETSADGENYDLTASGVVSFYFNPYLPGGGRKIPVLIHPTLPPGTILAMASQLPPYFKTNATPNVVEVLCRRDYYDIDWAERTREYEFGIYAEESLAVYAPFGLGVISGIANG